MISAASRKRNIISKINLFDDFLQDTIIIEGKKSQNDEKWLRCKNTR